MSLDTKNSVPPPPRHAPSNDEEKKSDATLATKQKAMIVRAEKKQLLSKLYEDHNIDISFLLLAFKKFRDKDKSNTYQLNFDLFCEILQIEPIGEYRRLFSLFDRNESDTIDVREFILGLANISSRDREKKSRLCFDLFDEDRNGFLTRGELCAVLCANHMETDPKRINRKCDTILRYGDGDGDNRINPKEFLEIAKKFPNILFPSAQATTK